MRFKIISARELISLLPMDDALLIDLRMKEDFDGEHIPGAVWADWETLDKSIIPLLDGAATPVKNIVLYCDHGNISLLAARDLAKIGYSVTTVNGGYSAYRKALHSK